MMEGLIERVNRYIRKADEAGIVYRQAVSALESQQEKLLELKTEHDFVVRALQALSDVRPLLSASALDKAQELANQALQVVFQTDDSLKFVEEDKRFVIQTPNGDTDLIQANGGGYLAVVSFVFSLFLLMKSKRRRFLVLDEQFTMISDSALERFIDFLRQLCADLQIDVMLITHDARIELQAVDKAYVVSDGFVSKLK